MNTKKLHIVYHCFCAKDWESIVREQFQYIRGRKIHCTLVGSPEDESRILKIAKKENILIECNRFDDPEIFEHEAMKLAFEVSKKNPGDYLLYFHAKGTSSDDQLGNTWRHYMNNRLLGEIESILEKLYNSAYDATGLLFTKVRWDRDLKRTNMSFFAGNFWIASCGYVASLPDYEMLRKKFKNNRYLAERYLGWNKPDIMFIDQSKSYGMSRFTNHISKRLNNLKM